MNLKPSNRIQPSPRAVAMVLALALALLVLPALLAPRADAYVYWTLDSGIGRADLDGTHIDQDFVRLGCPLETRPSKAPPPTFCDPGALAVDASHFYWRSRPTYSPVSDAVARANLDGTGVDRNFISGDWVGGYDIAVDAEHVYWDTGICCSEGTIARANLDGTGAELSFLSFISGYAVTLAVDDAHIYWTNDDGTIGRANLDGTGRNENFIVTVHADDIAVDDAHIYWSDATTTYPMGSIGRANLDGTRVDPDFVSGLDAIPLSLAVDAGHIYWADPKNLAIGRANLDGTGVDGSFIDAGLYPRYVAIDALGHPGTATAKQTQKQKGKQIRVKVKVTAEEELTAEASGKIKVNRAYKLKPKTAQVAVGHTETLKLKPKKAHGKKIARALERGEKAKAKATVNLTDQAGNSTTEKLRVRLKR
jgi:hypothetical protein